VWFCWFGGVELGYVGCCWWFVVGLVECGEVVVCDVGWFVVLVGGVLCLFFGLGVGVLVCCFFVWFCWYCVGCVLSGLGGWCCVSE